MFLLLVLSVVLHQAYATLSDKIDVWPLRIFYLRFLEFIGRVSIFPIAGGFFLQGINELSEILIYGMVFIILPITGTIVVREFFGIKKARETALLRLLDKINSPDCRVDQLSIIEIVVFNYWAFGAFSRSALGISNYLVKHGPFPNPNEQKLTLANFALVDDLIHGRPTATGVELSDMSSRVSHRLGPGSATTNPMTAEVHRRHETPFEARPRSDSHTSAISNTSSAPQFRVVKAKQVEQQFQDQQQENFRQSIMSLNDSDDE